MANALKEAPSKNSSLEEKVLSQEFDPNKKYVFELAVESPERELPVVEVTGQKSRIAPRKRFKPFQNIVMTSQIIWNGQRQIIRYYDGCDTIFVKDQPKEKETIDQFIKQSRPRNFIDGKFICSGDEHWLLMYLTICSWNVDSPFRTQAANGIFKAVNPDLIATQESEKLDKTEKALEAAKTASFEKMKIHASYLGISLTDYDTNNELSEMTIRTKYRKEALRNPESFLASFGNQRIELKYYIDKALEKGIINNKLNPNKAAWSSSNSVICDVSGLKSSEAIAQRLFEFAQTEEGDEFAIQLRTILQ